jgi:hypothetical protein
MWNKFSVAQPTRGCNRVAEDFECVEAKRFSVGFHATMMG